MNNVRMPRRRITCRRIVTPKAPGVLKQYGSYRANLRAQHGNSEVLMHDMGVLAYAVVCVIGFVLLASLLVVAVVSIS